MNEPINLQEMIAAIASKTGLEPARVEVVLNHEQAFINSAQADVNGEVEIDHDELVDYIMKRKDVGLNELQVEQVLDAEMDYLTDKGFAGYED